MQLPKFDISQFASALHQVQWFLAGAALASSFILHSSVPIDVSIYVC